jgi:hypothetical protein
MGLPRIVPPCVVSHPSKREGGMKTFQSKLVCVNLVEQDGVGICCKVGLFNTAMHSLGKSFLKKDMRLILYRTTTQLSNPYLIKCKHQIRYCALLDPTKLLEILGLRESYCKEGLQVCKSWSFNNLDPASNLYK